MNSRLLMAAIAAMASLVAADAARAQAPPQVGEIAGVWRNPKNSVHVDIKPCGAAVCGYVVWANAKAEADTRKAGNPKLVGMQLLRDFTPRGSAWRGKVFVPDLNATFSGTAEMIDADTLKARGCLIAGIACKTQLWRRVHTTAD